MLKIIKIEIETMTICLWEWFQVHVSLFNLKYYPDILILETKYILSPLIFFSLSKARTWFSNVICPDLFNVQWFKVAIVRFVDIVDNVDLSFRFIVVLFNPLKSTSHRYMVPSFFAGLFIYRTRELTQCGDLHRVCMSILYSFERFICGMWILTD
jgi:hypothetical protein